MKRVETKVYLTPEERDYLDTQATKQLITRSELIRDRALGADGIPAITLPAYHRAIEAAARTVSGIPRHQLEAIVASVIAAVGKQPA